MSEIQTYDTRLPGTIKVFFKVINGEVDSITLGNQAVSTDRGYQFYVDNYVAEQIDKCDLVINGLIPKLKVREGEILEVPEKTEREIEIERLEYELEQKRKELNNNE